MLTVILKVPQEYCFSQFYARCAGGGKHGASTALYGANNWQH